MTATLDRPAPPVGASLPGWRERLQPLVGGGGGWGVTLFVTVVAGLLRFLRLDQPASTLNSKGIAEGPGYIFDELYYACDAHNLLQHGVERVTRANAAFCTAEPSGAFIVHPPLGKWLIAMGEQLFGFNTFGWRFSAALFGTLTVLLVVRIGRRMTGSSLLGGLAGLLLALDGLHFVQSRVAMVDVFLCFFVVATFGALVVDRDQARARLASNSEEQVENGGSLGARPWRWVAGACIGAAISTKWSAVFPELLMVVLALVWEVAARRTAGVRGPWRTTLRKATAPMLLTFVVLPVTLYLLSWTGWFLTDAGYDRHWAKGKDSVVFFAPEALRSLWHYHWEIYNFHHHLSAKHPYQSHPLSWLILQRPVSYYYPPGIHAGEYGCQVSSCSREVLAIGTPVLWWAMIPVSFGLVARWVSKRDWRAASLLALMLVSILAWIPSDREHRTMFLFYALPSAPFLCLAVALLAGWLLGPAGTTRRTAASIGIGVYTSLVLLNFAYFYPILAAVTLPYDGWFERMWFRSWI